MTRMRILVAVTLAVAAGAASAQLYRWTDEQGRVHVTDTPPPPNAKNVQKKAVPAPSASAPAPVEPYSLTLLRKNFPVTLYSTPGCDACDDARKLLNARGIPFDEISVISDQQIAELKQAANTNSVPAMIVGSTVQRGFEEGAYNKLLDAAGYPKAGVLPARNQAEPVAPGDPKVEVKPAATPQDESPRGPYAGKPPAVPQPEIPAPYKPGAPPQRIQKK
jgi:glutaredoxin